MVRFDRLLSYIPTGMHVRIVTVKLVGISVNLEFVEIRLLFGVVLHAVLAVLQVCALMRMTNAVGLSS